MRVTILGILFFVLIGTNSSAQSKSSWKNATVNLPDTVMSKLELIDCLANQLGYYFSYNPVLIEQANPLHFKTDTVSVIEALNVIVENTNLDFSVDNKQVVIYPRVKNAEIEKSLEVYGFVLDEKRHKPIPYCNIAIAGTSLGTISNIDGFFRIILPDSLTNDTIVFSCLGFTVAEYKVADIYGNTNSIVLFQTDIQLKPININYYDPDIVLEHIYDNLTANYDQNYALYEAFYRETIKEDGKYTDVSEAVLQVMKAPYDKGLRKDHVKFLKGRKSSTKAYNQQLRFKLQGGPFYITKLDVVKNLESFIDPEFRDLYNYKYENYINRNGRPTIVLSFKPSKEMNDVLYVGRLFVDAETWALSRIEFSLPKQALQRLSHLFIQKIPLKYKAVANDLLYCIDYQSYNGIWYLFSARSELKINVRKRRSFFKTQFVGVSEILTTYVERGDFEYFDRHDFFKSSEFITEKIVDYDQEFWKQYNVIAPDEELVEALKHLTNKKLLTTKSTE